MNRNPGKGWLASGLAAVFLGMLLAALPVALVAQTAPLQTLSGGSQGRPGGPGGPPGAPLRVLHNLEYAHVGSRALHLDLYLRDTRDKAPLPVVVWVHGGGWVGGDKEPSPAARLVANGYAVASVEYRLAGEATFPAQLYDIKAAVRWLRANATQYNLDGDHIGAWGNSAGGHLVSLLGTTGDVKELEGDEGNPGQSSRVQAVVDFYGPIDLMRMDTTASKPKSDLPTLSEAILLGGPLSKNVGKAKAANPMTYITPDDPPFLIVQGESDPLVPPMQAEFFQRALKMGGVENDLVFVPGAGHAIAQVETPEVAEAVNNFFDKHLRGGKHQRDDVTTISEPADSWIDVFPDDLAPMRNVLYATPARGPGTMASYRVYLPPGYDQSKNAKRSYPVIYYLHGLNDDSRKAVIAEYIQRLDVAIRSGVMPPAIVIAVQGLNHGWYVDSPDGKYPMESVIMKDLIPHVDKTYRTVTTREGRAIEGHSMGGAGALHLGFKYPEMFGSVASLSAAAIPGPEFNTSAMNDEMLKTMFGGSIERYDAEGGWTLVQKNADKIRGRTNIRMICGDKDGLLVRTQWLSGIMDKLNIPHEVILSPGAPHSVKEVLARLQVDPFVFYGKAFAQYKQKDSLEDWQPKMGPPAK